MSRQTLNAIGIIKRKLKVKHVLFANFLSWKTSHVSLRETADFQRMEFLFFLKQIVYQITKNFSSRQFCEILLNILSMTLKYRDCNLLEKHHINTIRFFDLLLRHWTVMVGCYIVQCSMGIGYNPTTKVNTLLFNN
jgi:hypothetical protein